MSVRESIDRALGPVGPDSGCEGTALHLPRYAELAAAGDDVAGAFPAVANHLAACPDCHQDYEALLDCLTRFDGPAQRSERPARGAR